MEVPPLRSDDFLAPPSVDVEATKAERRETWSFALHAIWILASYSAGILAVILTSWANYQGIMWVVLAVMVMVCAPMTIGLAVMLRRRERPWQLALLAILPPAGLFVLLSLANERKSSNVDYTASNYPRYDDELMDFEEYEA